MISKWLMILSEFEIEYVYRKAIRGKIIVDQLAEAPIIDNHPMMIDFLNEFVFIVTTSNKWKLLFYGWHTRHGLGLGIHFVTPQGDSIPKSFRIIFRFTKNIIEYEALMVGLQTMVQWKIKDLKVYGDSQIIIN